MNKYDFSENRIYQVEDPVWFNKLPDTVDTYALNLYRYVYLSNQRQSNAHSKTRAMVRGGGRKPYSQKGTGRARAGSIRSPIWRGGGKAHGPNGLQNYSLTLNKKQKKHAFLSVLARHNLRNALNLISGVESISKTKQFLELVDFLSVNNFLLVTDKTIRSLVNSCKNLKHNKFYVRSLLDLNVYDLMLVDNVFFLDSNSLHELILKKLVNNL